MKNKIYMLLPFIPVMFISNLSFCQSQGPNYPDTVFNIPYHSGNPWIHPLRAKDSNKVYAEDSVGLTTGFSDYLEATGFNFSIPSNAIITGITVGVFGHDSVRSLLFAHDYINLVKNGVIQHDSILGTGIGTGMDRWQIWGGCNNMWNDTTITYADINNPDFGAAYSLNAAFITTTGVLYAYIDVIRISVCYTLPTSTETFTQTSVAGNIYPNPSHGLVTLNNKGKYEVKVNDITGKEIYNSMLNGAQNLDLSFLQNGMYFMQIVSGTDIHVRKLVIQK